MRAEAPAHPDIAVRSGDAGNQLPAPAGEAKGIADADDLVGPIFMGLGGHAQADACAGCDDFAAIASPTIVWKAATAPSWRGDSRPVS